MFKIIFFSPSVNDNITAIGQPKAANLNDSTEFGVAHVLDVYGYVNVHLGAIQTESTVYQRNIEDNLE
ncbi:hypothetical protein P700755_003091 [Psychroflexus torquis ATCC 700755]|uniref:Uncharacterized protein n=1 Tax=Psychroflexus torquis (strain ATCC 700755 / CIP 106069 / ACAM 623) TaxID=313595 RepID=K4IKZ0_PSYTT|nr:hypothetical protein P700755_003091 [Psychroflexus torquis ATCC 700755]